MSKHIKLIQMLSNSERNETMIFKQATQSGDKQTSKYEQSKWNKEERHKKWFKRYIFFPIFILCLPLVIAFSCLLGDYMLTAIFQESEANREQAAKTKHDYTAKLLGEAHTHLHRKEADDAQRMFSYLLQENRYDYRANYGMAQTLIFQCTEQNLHCELAKQYAVFTKGLNGKHHSELDLALSRLE